uniref:Uncharacterized protein n=1 Tax=Utricularia reniformis TaxID=192314 RepID=A0A1Y0AZZ2_9LAMI|nr:hypothetical protein AEK19_MT0495 [Utricularia reniformis]ART30752.1 hypothetical protein AEK19_MT0495 [Utricularia reniformis]
MFLYYLPCITHADRKATGNGFIAGPSAAAVLIM